MSSISEVFLLQNKNLLRKSLREIVSVTGLFDSLVILVDWQGHRNKACWRRGSARSPDPVRML